VSEAAPGTASVAGSSPAIVPAWCRKTPKVAGVLPLLFLHRLSSSDFGPAEDQFQASSAGSVGLGDHLG